MANTIDILVLVSTGCKFPVVSGGIHTLSHPSQTAKWSMLRPGPHRRMATALSDASLVAAVNS